MEFRSTEIERHLSFLGGGLVEAGFGWATLVRVRLD